MIYMSLINHIIMCDNYKMLNVTLIKISRYFIKIKVNVIIHEES